MTEPGPTVAVVFPELLGTYGDGGNVTVLRQRLLWRGVAPEFVTVGLADPVPSGCDLYLLGGGEDDAQAHALAALRRSPGLTVAVEGGATVLAVCAGLQMLGSSITGRDGTVQDGLALLDADTSPRATRAVGDVVATASPELGLGRLTGFENHAGGTRLGPGARPLATVRKGVGNGGPGTGSATPHDEGAVQGRIVATYLHGPVLARNPALADLVLSWALGRHLEPLPDDVAASVGEPEHQPLGARVRQALRLGRR